LLLLSASRFSTGALEISRVRRRLLPPGWHQQAIRAPVTFLADSDQRGASVQWSNYSTLQTGSDGKRQLQAVILLRVSLMASLFYTDFRTSIESTSPSGSSLASPRETVSRAVSCMGPSRPDLSPKTRVSLCCPLRPTAKAVTPEGFLVLRACFCTSRGRYTWLIYSLLSREQTPNARTTNATSIAQLTRSAISFK
jgi:hypothetical protein